MTSLVRALLLSLFAVGAAATASAQEQATPPSTETLQAEAARMLAEAGATEFFVAESRPPAIMVRHTGSGMLCRFAYGGDSEVTIVPSAPLGIPRGDDVACGTRTSLGTLTLYATRYPQSQTLDEALGSAVAALRAVHPEAREVDLSTLEWATVGDTPAPVSRSAAFTIPLDGQPAFTRISIFVADGWQYKLRFTSSTPRANLFADMLWVSMLNDLAERQAAAAP